MKTKKFIIAIQDPNPSQQERLWNEIQRFEKIAIWHWLKSTWLITTENENIDIQLITNLVNQNFPDNYFIVNEVKIINWQAKGPHTKERNMFTWLFKFWKTEKERFPEIT